MFSSKKLYSIGFLLIAILIPLIISGIVFDVYEGAGPSSSAGNGSLAKGCASGTGATGACASVAKTTAGANANATTLINTYKNIEI